MTTFTPTILARPRSTFSHWCTTGVTAVARSREEGVTVLPPRQDGGDGDGVVDPVQRRCPPRRGRGAYRRPGGARLPEPAPHHRRRPHRPAPARRWCHRGRAGARAAVRGRGE